MKRDWKMIIKIASAPTDFYVKFQTDIPKKDLKENIFGVGRKS